MKGAPLIFAFCEYCIGKAEFRVIGRCLHWIDNQPLSFCSHMMIMQLQCAIGKEIMALRYFVHGRSTIAIQCTLYYAYQLVYTHASGV